MKSLYIRTEISHQKKGNSVSGLKHQLPPNFQVCVTDFDCDSTLPSKAQIVGANSLK